MTLPDQAYDEIVAVLVAAAERLAKEEPETGDTG
jgi:hypothetical protein